MFSPSSKISPFGCESGISAFRRLIARRNVDFPQPEGPMNALTDRGGIVRSMSNSACFFPYQNEKARASIEPTVIGSSCTGAVGGEGIVALIRSGR